MHALLILASGKSSRFGGYPKAFCLIDDTYIAQHTINHGSKFFDKTYLVINREIYPMYKDAVHGCTTIAIGTGQGDSHSFLRAARLIKEDCGAERITLCWGDTVYFDEDIFKKAAELVVDEAAAGVSLASIDKEPYAWYEPDGDKIRASHFRGEEGTVETGIHDQSVFVFNTEVICKQLEQYMDALGLNDEEDYVNKEVSKEMKMLNAFTFFYEKYSTDAMLPMKFALIESGHSYSFNTQEELDFIRSMVKY